MTPAVEVVPAGPDERHELFALAKTAFGETPGWSDPRVLGTLMDDDVFIAREDARPAGYVALRHVPEVGIVIEQLLVAPGHERRGIGRRLLAYAEGYAIAEGAAALQIAVEQTNPRARGFYLRCGFVPVGAEVYELTLPTLG